MQGESPPLVDLDGDGRPQIVCHWEGRRGWIEPDWSQPREPWKFHPLSDPGEWKEFYHGTGVGDLSGDGRLDLVLNDGWFEQPQKELEQANAPPRTAWAWHPHVFSADRGGEQMPIYDVDGDGDNDVLSAMNAHGWGIAWFEQVPGGDAISFLPHPIMGNARRA